MLLLANGDDIEATPNDVIHGMYGIDNEKPVRMNSILRLNNEQLIAMLGGGGLKAIVKGGKIVGIRVGEEEIKCNSIKETGGNLYQEVLNDDHDKKAVNFGQLDSRLSLVNYKPNEGRIFLQNIEQKRQLLLIVEKLADYIDNNPSMKSNRQGIILKFDELIPKLHEDLKSKVDESIIKTCVEMIRCRDNEGAEILSWSWIKQLQGFNNDRWVKRLYQEGYRRDDNYTMIFT